MVGNGGGNGGLWVDGLSVGSGGIETLMLDEPDVGDGSMSSSNLVVEDSTSCDIGDEDDLLCCSIVLPDIDAAPKVDVLLAITDESRIWDPELLVASDDRLSVELESTALRVPAVGSNVLESPTRLVVRLRVSIGCMLVDGFEESSVSVEDGLAIPKLESEAGVAESSICVCEDSSEESDDCVEVGLAIPELESEAGVAGSSICVCEDSSEESDDCIEVGLAVPELGSEAGVAEPSVCVCEIGTEVAALGDPSETDTGVGGSNKAVEVEGVATG